MPKFEDREMVIWFSLVAVQLHGKNAVTDPVLKSAYEAADKVLLAARDRLMTDKEADILRAKRREQERTA